VDRRQPGRAAIVPPGGADMGFRVPNAKPEPHMRLTAALAFVLTTSALLDSALAIDMPARSLVTVTLSM